MIIHKLSLIVANGRQLSHFMSLQSHSLVNMEGIAKAVYPVSRRDCYITLINVMS